MKDSEEDSGEDSEEDSGEDSEEDSEEDSKRVWGGSGKGLEAEKHRFSLFFIGFAPIRILEITSSITPPGLVSDSFSFLESIRTL